MDKDYALLLKQGTAALEGNAYEKASALLTECYSEKKTFRVNYLLVTAFAKQGEYVAAGELAEEYLSEYIKNNDYFEKYILINARAGRFVHLKKLMSSIDSYLNKEERVSFTSMLAEEEVSFAAEHRDNVDKMRKKIMHCGQAGPLEQRKLFKQAYLLPSSVFLQVGKYLLSDPDVHSLIKSNIIDDFRTLKIAEKISFYFCDQKTYTLVPKKLHSLEQTNTYSYFQTKLMDDKNQILQNQRWREVRLKLILLYPFEQEIVLPSEKWLHAFLLDESLAGYPKKIKKWAKILENELSSWKIQ